MIEFLTHTYIKFSTRGLDISICFLVLMKKMGTTGKKALHNPQAFAFKFFGVSHKKINRIGIAHRTLINSFLQWHT